LYLVADWQTLLREARALIRDGGLLLHEWGNGTADEVWVQIREQARSIFQQAGVKAPFHPGARTEAEVDNCLHELGFVRVERIAAGVGPSMTIKDFLGKIENGELSYIWDVPTDIRAVCIPQLRRWVEQTFDLDRAVPIPGELHWTVYQKIG
jgi:hypothetical protein